MLVAARFVQGVGGAMTSAVILGMIVTMFPEPREQAKAIGVYAFVASAGGSIGLLAGGVLTQAINWHWIFFVNLPIGIATAVLATRLLERDAGIGFRRAPTSRRRADHRRADARRLHDRQARRRGRLGRGHDAGPGRRRRWRCWPRFVVREATARNPLMPLRIFRSRNVAGANLVQVLPVAGHVRHVLPGRAVPAARAGLRRARDRPRLPAGDARDGRRCRCATPSGWSCASAPARRWCRAWCSSPPAWLLFTRAPGARLLRARRPARRWC